jgi:hypothetical protein
MADATPETAPLAPLPLDMLDEHPDNPRVATWGLDELVNSIRELGVLTPCIVRPMGGARFQILSGHRRVRAAVELGRFTIPCQIVTANDSVAWKILLSENIQRRNLNVIEEARAFQKMRASGIPILGIANVRLALLELDEKHQAEVLAGDLSLTEAWSLVNAQRADRRGPKAGQGTGRHSKYNRHFNQHHPLAAEAEKCCDSAGHEIPPRLGPACARCWEEVIRDDQHLATWLELEIDEEPPPPRDMKAAS